ncbi:hypothetical protein QBC37DRAFT_322470 [Rhypophila decipiens]|uniref:DUF6594 domain-containing protein n=1 Tax=Rhypophila decipiens TaxID=261697 RepID=A0AAN6Y0E9_9PEZI|nr:hypothetical protein QBC37DRAFT_322470 [Rhypophila decipiens]
MRHLPSVLPCWNPSPSPPASNTQSPKKIEDFNAGYPRFTALIAAYEPYFTCRRFDRLRARLLLLKQDKLSRLEEQLDELDRTESYLLYLGVSRVDKNPQRLAVLSEIDSCLADYDDFIARSRRMLSLEKAQKRNVNSLQNWLDGTGCVDKDETIYLQHDHELVSLAAGQDGATLHLESWLEDIIIHVFGRCRMGRLGHVSNDPNVYMPRPWVKRTAKSLLLVVITLLLLVPVVICNIASTMISRIIIFVVSTVCYLVILSWLTRAKTMELVLAGAT